MCHNVESVTNWQHFSTMENKILCKILIKFVDLNFSIYSVVAFLVILAYIKIVQKYVYI